MYYVHVWTESLVDFGRPEEIGKEDSSPGVEDPLRVVGGRGNGLHKVLLVV